jgi:hypothetical protein
MHVSDAAAAAAPPLHPKYTDKNAQIAHSSHVNNQAGQIAESPSAHAPNISAEFFSPVPVDAKDGCAPPGKHQVVEPGPEFFTPAPVTGGREQALHGSGVHGSASSSSGMLSPPDKEETTGSGTRSRVVHARHESSQYTPPFNLVDSIVLAGAEEARRGKSMSVFASPAVGSPIRPVEHASAPPTESPYTKSSYVPAEAAGDGKSSPLFATSCEGSPISQEHQVASSPWVIHEAQTVILLMVFEIAGIFT